MKKTKKKIMMMNPLIFQTLMKKLLIQAKTRECVDLEKPISRTGKLRKSTNKLKIVKLRQNLKIKVKIKRSWCIISLRISSWIRLQEPKRMNCLHLFLQIFSSRNITQLICPFQTQYPYKNSINQRTWMKIRNNRIQINKTINNHSQQCLQQHQHHQL